MAAILLSLHNIVNGGFHRLRYERLPESINPQGPTLQTFEGFDRTGGAGADVSIVATREDGRQLFWQVEIWIDRYAGDDRWSAIVKGEIDLDDEDGNDRCVLNEQRTVDTGEQAGAAIRELARMVVNYPVDELLAMQWPPEVDEDDESEPLGTITTTITAIRLETDVEEQP